MMARIGPAVFLVGGWLLAAALIPTVRAGGGVPLETCALTGGVLTAYTGAFAFTGQRVSAVGVGANALLWIVLAAQAVVGQ